MSARHRRPAPVPLRYHFGLTAAVAAAVLFALIVLAHEGDPAILGGSVLLFGRSIHHGGRPQHWDGRSSLAVTWEAWSPKLAIRTARMRRGVVLFGRWLLADEHLLTLLKIGLLLAFVAAMVDASPAQVAIPVATALLVGVGVGLVLAVAHRHDPIRAGSLLGGKGGAR